MFFMRGHTNNDEDPHSLTELAENATILFTPKLREYDLGMFDVGHRRTLFLTIPPYQKDFKITKFCAPECTEKRFPPEGIKIYTVFLHAHLTGKKLLLRHIRNGQELAPISHDAAYDFNYQQYRQLQNEVTVLPGYELVLECDFDTTENNTFMFGGLSTRREMCEAFIMYYPKSSLVDCRSQAELNNFLNGFNVNKIAGEVMKKLYLPFDPARIPEKKRAMATPDDSYLLEYYKSADTEGDVFEELSVEDWDKSKYSTLFDYMKHGLDWQNRKWSKKVEKLWAGGPHYMHCAAVGGKRIPLDTHIKYLLNYHPYDDSLDSSHSQCHRLQSAASFQTLQSFSIMILPIIVSTMCHYILKTLW